MMSRLVVPGKKGAGWGGSALFLPTDLQTTNRRLSSASRLACFAIRGGESAVERGSEVDEHRLACLLLARSICSFIYLSIPVYSRSYLLERRLGRDGRVFIIRTAIHSFIYLFC